MDSIENVIMYWRDILMFHLQHLVINVMNLIAKNCHLWNDGQCFLLTMENVTPCSCSRLATAWTRISIGPCNSVDCVGLITIIDILTNRSTFGYDVVGLYSQCEYRGRCGISDAMMDFQSCSFSGSNRNCLKRLRCFWWHRWCRHGSSNNRDSTSGICQCIPW